jgi:hypothetical protein
MRQRPIGPLAPLAIVVAFAATLHAQSAPGAAKPALRQAQGAAAPARRPAPRVAPFGPQPGVTGTRNPTDLKTVLYYAADALGMLRGPREVDHVLTMELWGAGTITRDGRACRTSDYHAWVRYRAIPEAAAAANLAQLRGQFRGESQLIGVPALRVSATCAGSTTPRVDVVAGRYSWNEEKPGVNATPAMETFEDRATQLWTLIPESVVKAAILAGDKTMLAQENGKPVLTFPMPEPFQSATMKVWISPQIFRIDTNPAGQKTAYSHLIERSQLTAGGHVLETRYSEYGDWNEKDLNSMILLPRHIVQTRDGSTVVDLTFSKTDTFNPYVIMPIPAALPRPGSQTAAQSR